MADLRHRLLDRLEHEPPAPAPAATALPVPATPAAAPPREPKAPRLHLYRPGVWFPMGTRGVCGAQLGRFEEITHILSRVTCSRCRRWLGKHARTADPVKLAVDMLGAQFAEEARRG